MHLPSAKLQARHVVTPLYVNSWWYLPLVHCVSSSE